MSKKPEKLDLGKIRQLKTGKSGTDLLEKQGWRKVFHENDFLGWRQPAWAGRETKLYTTSEALNLQKIFEKKYYRKQA